MIGMPWSLWSVSSDTYHGAFAIALIIFDWSKNKNKKNKNKHKLETA
jgi:hypothetical protein